MPPSAALLPAPYYPPVRSGSGALTRYHPPLRPPQPFNPARPPRAADPDQAGLAYSRMGRLIGDGQVGQLVDIYV